MDNFAATGCSIISDAVAERIKFLSFIVFGTLMVAFLYPLTGHWIWGGGWLSKLGFHDFAGSTAVHSVGGWCALIGILLLGPRTGKIGDGKIFILDLPQCIRIRTGEEGKEAIG